ELRWLILKENGSVYKTLSQNDDIACSTMDGLTARVILRHAIFAQDITLCRKLRFFLDSDLFDKAIINKNKHIILQFKDAVKHYYLVDKLEKLYEIGEDVFQEFVVHSLKTTRFGYIGKCMSTAMSISSECAINLINIINDAIILYKTLEKNGSTIGDELENLYKKI